MSNKRSLWGKALGIFIEDTHAENLAPEVEELDLGNTDIEALLARTRALTGTLDATSTDVSPNTPTMLHPAQEKPTGILEGRPFKDIYQEVGCVPPAPQPVEVVMSFMRGLSAMPPEVQRTSLKALDEAHPDWTIDDVVIDARNKIEAMQRAKVNLMTQLQGIEAHTQAELGARDSEIAKVNSTVDGEIATLKEQAEEISAATDEQITLLRHQIATLEEKKAADAQELQEQIAQMESLRRQETLSADSAKESARTNLKNAMEMCGREAMRFDAHAAEIQKFITAFGPPAQGDIT